MSAILAVHTQVPGSKVSRASWLRSESVRDKEDDDELMLPPATMRWEVEGKLRGTAAVESVVMGGRR